jgi:hypothetical protein
VKIMLELRERFQVFYNKNNAYLVLLLKFIVALFFFLYINQTLGFMEPLNSIFVVLVLALICSLLSFVATMGIGFLLAIGHCYAVGIEVAAVALVLLLVLLIFYLRIAGADSVGAILTPLAFMWKIPFAIPMGLGLLRGPTSAFATVCGTIFYYFMKLVSDQASTIRGIDKSELAKKVKILVDGLIQNKEMWMTIVVSVAVVLIVYSLRCMAVKFAWDIAIVTSGIAYLVIRIGASTILDLEIFFSGMLLQVIVVCSLAFLVKLFVFNVDYTRTESLQYEDDDYYYYVKAIPKINVERQKRHNKASSQSQQAEEE